LPRHVRFPNGWCVAIYLCIAVVAGYQTARAATDRLNPAAAAHLQSTLDRYLTIEKQGGWPTIPDGPALRVGSSGPPVVRLKERLSATNDLMRVNREFLEFGSDLSLGVMRFQRRHGLAVDGVVGRVTRAALNVSVAERIRQISVNLARLRSLPAQDTKRAIVINVAGFDLNLIENDKVAFSSPVIVGRSSRPTPALSSVVTQIIVSPYWHVPRSIAVRDILPKIKRDPLYLQTQGIRVFRASGDSRIEVAADTVPWQSLDKGNFPYVLVQDPGARNALGRVKFFLPNEQDIFVHGTPARELFNRTLRAFSSGCIRVARIMELAEYLLKLEGGDSYRDFSDALRTGETRRIKLATPIPIHIVYLTAWADADGQTHFRDDIYSLDSLAGARLTSQGNIRRDVARASDTVADPACPATPSAGGLIR
jgi:murein L,D-transpeptidase YcbB/YkuD